MIFPKIETISLMLAPLGLIKSCSAEDLPIVDLDYELHQALSYNNVTDVYTFSNIRYAQDPTADLRFRAPRFPQSNRDIVQNGTQRRVCPQGVPKWQAKTFAPIGQYSAGLPFNMTGWEKAISKSTPINTTVFNANATEDCLFLDVHVPRSVLERSRYANCSEQGAPVLVWIHGGGFVFDSKNGVPTPNYDPSGLFLAAKQAQDQGMIFVALNYRLGAFGFLAGDEVARDGNLNAGILDQRFALDWVAKYISRFAGAKDKVTIMGESAGGGSFLHHLTAYGGKNGPAPFAQVIAQSPVVPPVRPNDSEKVFNLISANAKFIQTAPPTTFYFGIVVDDSYIPNLTSQLLATGQFNKTVRVMSAHNSFEGSFFFDPNVHTDTDLQSWVQNILPGLNSTSTDEMLSKIYPNQYDGSFGYSDIGSRQTTIRGEAFIDCNYLNINEGLGGNGYAYEFAVSPSLHTQDLTYTFGTPASPARSLLAQNILQKAIVSFVLTGNATAQMGDQDNAFPVYGQDGKQIQITADGAPVTMSPVNKTRCAWWREQGM